MSDFKALFIKYLTEDINPAQATAIFNNETGVQLWYKIRLDMILSAFDEAEKEFLMLK